METKNPLYLFLDQAKRDFEELIKPLPATTKMVTSPKYLFNYQLSLINYIVKANAKNRSNKMNYRIVRLENIEPSQAKEELIVIAAAEPTNINKILDVFDSCPNYTKSIFIIPRITAFVQQAFDVRGYKPVQGLPKNTQNEIYVPEFHYDFLPVDVDFFLLPCYHSFYQINVENDYNDIYAAARALAKIQIVFGEIPFTVVFGQSAVYAKSLTDGLMRKSGSSCTQFPLIDGIILFDRSCDLATPLLTQVTLEAHLDEEKGINYGIIEYDGSHLVFNEDIEVIANSRCELMTTVSETLSQKLKELTSYSNESGKRNFSSNAEFAEYAIKMKKLQLEQKPLQLLLNITDSCVAGRNYFDQVLMNSEFDLVLQSIPVISIAESCIHFQNDWKTALRFILLQLIVNGKEVNPQLFDETLADQFGINAKDTIRTLERLDLLKIDQKTVNSKWKSLKDMFNLTTPMEKNELDDHVFQMCDKCVPLLVRLVEYISNGKFVPQKVTEATGIPASISGKCPPSVPGKPRKILVFVVGGITLSEVNFIRKFGKTLSNGKYQFIIGSTDQTNKNNFLDQLCPGLFDV